MVILSTHFFYSENVNLTIGHRFFLRSLCIEKKVTTKNLRIKEEALTYFFFSTILGQGNIFVL